MATVFDLPPDIVAAVTGLTDEQSRELHRANHDMLHAVMLNAPHLIAASDGTDVTASIQEQVNQAAGGALFIPPVGEGQAYTISGKIAVPSNTTLFGIGYASRLKMTGVDPLNAATEYGAFDVARGNSNIRIDGIHISGEFPDLAEWGTSESAGIKIWQDCEHVNVHNCWFTGLAGFSVHQPAGAKFCHVTHCVMRHCGNGLNANSDYGIFAQNTFYLSEGIEASGIGAQVINNTFVKPLGTAVISLGGNTAPGFVIPSQQAVGNYIDSPTHPDVVCIVTAEASTGALISNNMIVNLPADGTATGIGVVYGTDNVLSRNIIQSAPRGVTVSSHAVRPQVLDNIILNSAAVPLVIGITTYAENTRIERNYIGGASLYDIKLHDAPNCILSNNIAPVINLYGTASIKNGNSLVSPNGTTYIINVSDQGELSVS